MENLPPHIVITYEMISSAKELIPSTKVNRTIASEIDTLTGHLGEFAFAQFFYGDWKKNRVGENKGDVNFKDIEIKTSAFPFNKNLNLLVREDYAKKRKPPFYIQIIIDVDDPKANEIKDGTRAYICGFATAADVDSAPLRDFGSKFGGKGGYRCHYINIQNLKPMNTFEENYKKHK
jgi:hypothetical protein